ncbi:MAG: YHS domain-containing protein [Desulfobacterales bacterium]|nr:YHS domain-containing protein [Deltaproteobacteria bacterium]NNL76139.1 YHS domain-containing protein [Desulfobacterales bacterium]
MDTSNTEHNFIDPVCQMKVAKGSKVPSFVFQSETYHFCANSCRNAFMADPQKYLKSKSNKRKGFWGRYLDRLNKATGGKPPCCH